MTSSAADASSSATQISVATSSRPPASVVPLRSTTAATPAHPMATSVTPRRHGRPKVSETITPSVEPEGVLQPRPDAAGRTVRVLGQQRRGPVRHVGEVDAGVGADEAVPRLADHQVTALAENAHRLLSHQGQLGRRIGVIELDQPALRLRDDLLRDHDHVAGRELGPVGVRRRDRTGDERSQVGSGRHLAEAGDGEDLHALSRRHRPPPAPAPRPAPACS